METLGMAMSVVELLPGSRALDLGGVPLDGGAPFQPGELLVAPARPVPSRVLVSQLRLFVARSRLPVPSRGVIPPRGVRHRIPATGRLAV